MTGEPGTDTAPAPPETAAGVPIVEARKMTRILPGPVPVTLVKDIDLSIHPGELVAITGPSGSGKSSLLYLLGLLDAPTEGAVLIDGEDASSLDAEAQAHIRLARIGFVFQFHFLLPEFRVLDNVTVPMRKLARLSPRAAEDRGRQLLEDMDLGDHTRKRPDQLSGGQRQRVAVARALANDPQLILADEPTGSLDQKSSQNVFEIFQRLVRDQHRTIVMVTHEADLAEACDRQIHLVDGKIVRDGKNAH